MSQKALLISYINVNIITLYDLCDIYKLLLPYSDTLVDMTTERTSPFSIEKDDRLRKVISSLCRELTYTFGTLELMSRKYYDIYMILVKEKLIDFVNKSTHKYILLILLELIFMVKEIIINKVRGVNTFTSELYLDNLAKLVKCPEYTHTLNCAYVEYIIKKKEPLNNLDWPSYYYNARRVTVGDGNYTPPNITVFPTIVIQ